MPRKEFQARMDERIEQVKGGERLDSVEELLVTGERGRRRAVPQGEGVVSLSKASWHALNQACAALDVARPEPISS